MNKTIKQSAYHEAGHVIINYLFAYTCDEIVLNNAPDGDAYNLANYGEDLLLITGIINAKEDPEIFNGLSSDIRKNTFQASNRIALILLAGSVAESIHLNGGKISENMNAEISGPDLTRVQNVDFLLSTKPDHDPKFIETKLDELYSFFSLEEFWIATEALATAVLAKPDYKLVKTEIEDILDKTGFLSFIKKYQ
jgi:hypothetical protein